MQSPRRGRHQKVVPRDTKPYRYRQRTDPRSDTNITTRNATHSTHNPNRNHTCSIGVPPAVTRRSRVIGRCPEIVTTAGVRLLLQHLGSRPLRCDGHGRPYSDARRGRNIAYKGLPRTSRRRVAGFQHRDSPNSWLGFHKTPRPCGCRSASFAYSDSR